MRQAPQSYVYRFARNSCYLFALARAAEIISGKELSADDIFSAAIRSKFVSEDAYVRDAEGFLQEVCGVKCKVAKYKENDKIEISEKAVVITHYQHGSRHHFNLSDWDSMMFVPDFALDDQNIQGYRIVEPV